MEGFAKMKDIYVEYSDIDPKKEYLATNKDLVTNMRSYLEWADTSLEWEPDDGDDAKELEFTDRLCRIVACGKTAESLEVVSIYNGWTQYEHNKGRDPVYILHYAGLSYKTNPARPWVQIYPHSFVREEALKHKSNDTIHVPTCGSPFMNTVDINGLGEEVRYNCFIVLDRKGTRYTLPQLVGKTERAALKDLRGKDLHTTCPVPCFSDDGKRA